MTSFTVLSGLPTSGPRAQSFPESLGLRGREGYVVEFLSGTPDSWVGNFEGGLGGYEGVHGHPNGRDVIVFASGSGYVIDPTTRVLVVKLPGEINQIWTVADEPRIICDLQQLAFFCLTANGIRWHTRRLSWDGFRDVVVGRDRITGNAWGPDPDGEEWKPFEVDARTGRSTGGAFDDRNSEGWESLAVN